MTFFVFSSLASGGLLYLYQVLASRWLSTAEFSELNAWLANFSVFLMIGGLLQYASNFFPTPKRQLRVLLLLLLVSYAAMTYLWFTTPGPLGASKAALCVVAISLFGWLQGQIQIRLAFATLAMINILVGLSKLTAPFGLEQFDFTTLERLAWACFACHLPPVMLAVVYLWRTEDHPRLKRPEASGLALWSAPVLLSATNAIVPQLDLILMNHTQSDLAFQAFAQSSMFYKGIYFLTFILAQWLLPQQIRGQSVHSTWIQLRRYAGLSVVLCVLLTLVSPWISAWIFKWSSPPPMQLVLLSCLHMSALTITYLEIQRACATSRLDIGATLVAAIGLSAIIQWLAQLPMTTYLIAAMLWQVGLILWAQRSNTRKIASR